MTKDDKRSKQQLLWQKIIFTIIGIACLTPFVSPPIALLLGLFVAQFVGHPYLHLNQKVTKFLLKASVVGLGFGMNLESAIKVGKEGLIFTIITIVFVLSMGFFLGKMLKVNAKISYLIAAGTAICGGSAIAAIAPVIKAKEKQISIAIGTIFILNSIALLLFPFIGTFLELSQHQFGLWCAIAIHDTSSVVGAASKYGDEALSIATTVKLARALWIIPLAFLSTFIFENKEGKIKIPYFIGWFVLAMVVNSYSPFVQGHAASLVHLAKIGLTLTLFLIGCGLNSKILQSVGWQPLFQGLLLWLFISSMTLWVIYSFYH